MKRKNNSKIITFFYLFLLLFNLNMFAFFDTNIIIKPNNLNSSQTGQDLVCIYVDSTYAHFINSEINQYKSDLETDGYVVNLYNWSDTNVLNLKSNLTLEYNNGMIGAVFVGNIPYALYEPDAGLPLYIGFPCDLFLMDLDGTWSDINLPNGIYDTHVNGTGDMYPEIFIGRINPFKISWTVSQAIIRLKAYFQRNHQYRLNQTQRYNNSLMYIDDPWESYSHEWKNDMNYLYSNVTLINNSQPGDPSVHTKAAGYLMELNKSYEFVHAFIHSNHTHHGFDWTSNPPPPTTSFVNYSDISTINTKALFYNLYCCYAAKFDEIDNIGSHYLFNSNNTLAIYGCARSGGFVMNQYLYKPLNNGSTLGSAFKYWWSNDILDPVVHTHGPGDMDVKGNCLLGDPFLRIREPKSGSDINGGDDNGGNNNGDGSGSGLTDLQKNIILGASLVALVIVVTLIIRKKK